jgi:hypothetical protein
MKAWGCALLLLGCWCASTAVAAAEVGSDTLLGLGEECRLHCEICCCVWQKCGCVGL